MKKTIGLLAILFLHILSYAQESGAKELAKLELKNLDGSTVNTADLVKNGPVVVSFWATWCAPCKRELNTIHELYNQWKTETGITLVAVSIDDDKTKAQVPVYVNGKGWNYTILLDPNGDFKKAMEVNNVPHTFLIDGTGKVVYSHNSYAPGDENKLYEEIKKIAKK